MRLILILGLGALCLMTFTATQAFALAVAPEACETNADCQDGYECLLACTETSADDSEGSQCEGTCEPKSNKNECEVEADCPTGFDCVEHTSWSSTTDGREGPESFEVPCREGEDCDESGQEEPDEGDPIEPTETEETVKACAPKACDTDAECGGELVCVLETYGCQEEPLVEMAPVPEPDCPEGEDCGGSPEEDSQDPQEPKEGQDNCEPETVGHCAPAWLAPCEADLDCGPGFACVEEEICWASSGGSMGSSGGAPDRAPCDPDDEDCGGKDSGEGFAPPPPEEGEGEGEEMPNEGCETTGEFYCELQIIDCSTDACPEGLVCVSAPEESQTEDCAVSSDGEMDCEESEDDGEFPDQVCVPENFEDWIGAGSGGQSLEVSGSTEDGDENPGAPITTAEDDGNSGSSSGGSSDSGCSGAGSGVPFGALLMALGVIGLIGRRRS